MSFVAQIDLKLSEQLKADLQEQGFEFSQPPHTLFQGKKKGVICTLYTSGKLMVQGKEMKSFIEYYLEPEILHSFTFGYEKIALDLTPRIGIDESGKGDFFGPLCIGGVYAQGEQITALLQLGVKDSKRLSDGTILKMAHKIRKDFAYHVVRINPQKYNELYGKFGNLNLLLAWGHATVIEALVEKTGCESIIIDQFAAEHVVANALKQKKKKVLLTQRTKAEQDPVVAAASILARAAFLEGLQLLEQKCKTTLPKGAGTQTIETGTHLVQTHGAQILPSLCKLHFKTTQIILKNSPSSLGE